MQPYCLARGAQDEVLQRQVCPDAALGVGDFDGVAARQEIALSDQVHDDGAAIGDGVFISRFETLEFLPLQVVAALAVDRDVEEEKHDRSPQLHLASFA